MKIMLLNPNDYMFTEINRSSNPNNTKIFPYGLAAIAAHLEGKSLSSNKLIPVDGMLYPHDSTKWLEDVVSEEEPDIIITIVNIITLHLWVDRVVKLKKEYGFTVVGLIHLPFGKDCIEKYPVFDVIADKEFLEVSANILKALDNKQPLQKVRGIHMQANGLGFYTGDCDHLSLHDYPQPAYQLFNLDYYTSFPMLWTDGCNYSCKYCYFGVYPTNGWEHKKIENIVNEITGLVDKKRTSISLEVIDHEFTLDPEFAISLLKEIAKVKTRLPINANTRVNRVNSELIRAAEKAGVTTFGIGVESGVQRVLDANNKGMTLAQIQNAVSLIHSSCIFLQGYIQVGLLEETGEDFIQTVAFVTNKLKLKRVELGMCIPYPGTAMESLLLERGWMANSLSIDNLVWIYKNVYNYTFLQTDYNGEQPYWRVSEQLDINRCIELFREYRGMMPKEKLSLPQKLKYLYNKYIQ